MHAAFSIWEERIAPVFDVAHTVYLAEVADGELVSGQEVQLPAGPAAYRAIQLVGLGVELLVCGAISRPLLATLNAYGIQVVSFVAGDVQQVLAAWLKGELQRDRFAMPGYCRNGQAWSAGRRKKGGDAMRKGGQGRDGTRGSGGMGRMGGNRAAGTGGTCRCPQCGHSEAHQRGVPCYNQQCPKCGTALVRA